MGSTLYLLPRINHPLGTMGAMSTNKFFFIVNGLISTRFSTAASREKRDLASSLDKIVISTSTAVRRRLSRGDDRLDCAWLHTNVLCGNG